MTPERIAARLFTPGKGLLGIDEHLDRLSTGMDGAAEFEAPAQRAMLLETPELDQWISGVLVAPEGLTQCHGVASAGIAVGVRLDAYRAEHALRDLVQLGANFVKWRADLDPFSTAGPAAYVDTDLLAQRAAASLEAGLLPMLDIAMPNQCSHSHAVAMAVTGNAIRALDLALAAASVPASQVVIRMNFVRPGRWHDDPADPDVVARTTLKLLREHVPPTIAGVMFMSTGLENDDACASLRAVSSQAAEAGLRLPITFAFGRALVAPATLAWTSHDDGGTDAGQAALSASCRAAAQALHPAATVG